MLPRASPDPTTAPRPSTHFRAHSRAVMLPARPPPPRLLHPPPARVRTGRVGARRRGEGLLRR